jgi:hypothetical protein
MYYEGADKTAEIAATAASVIIKDSILGSLLLVAVVGIVFLIRRLLAVQDLRVVDQVRSNEIMERSREKTVVLMEHVSKASNEVNSALDRFTDVQADTVKAVSELRVALMNLQNTMDSVIRDAVRGRSSGGSSSSPSNRQT